MSNTLKRTISGTAFIIIMIAGLIFNKYVYAGLVALLMILLMSEFYTMTLANKFKKSRVLAIIAGELLFGLIFCNVAFRCPIDILFFSVLPIIILMISSLYISKEDFKEFSMIYVGLLYIAIPLALSTYVVFERHTPYNFNGILMLCFFIIIWASDVGAFVFGITLGQKFGKKLCPEISPKKSWVGFWGGLLIAVLVAVVLKFTLIKYTPYADISIIHCIILAIIMHIAGVYGDLFESQWKRCYQLKDSGKIIPGHGGVLDRFDSSLFAIPAGVMYLLAINLIKFYIFA